MFLSHSFSLQKPLKAPLAAPPSGWEAFISLALAPGVCSSAQLTHLSRLQREPGAFWRCGQLARFWKHTNPGQPEVRYGKLKVNVMPRAKMKAHLNCSEERDREIWHTDEEKAMGLKRHRGQGYGESQGTLAAIRSWKDGETSPPPLEPPQRVWLCWNPDFGPADTNFRLLASRTMKD